MIIHADMRQSVSSTSCVLQGKINPHLLGLSRHHTLGDQQGFIPRTQRMRQSSLLVMPTQPA